MRGPAGPVGTDGSTRHALRSVEDPAVQLSLDDVNHFDRSHRQRDLAVAVERATYVGRGGVRQPYRDRHQLVLWWLTAYCDRDGRARISLKQLARDRGRDHSNLCRDVRDLASEGFVRRVPRPGQPDQWDYVLPGMRHPGRAGGGGRGNAPAPPPNRGGGAGAPPNGGAPAPPKRRQREELQNNARGNSKSAPAGTRGVWLHEVSRRPRVPLYEAEGRGQGVPPPPGWRDGLTDSS